MTDRMGGRKMVLAVAALLLALAVFFVATAPHPWIGEAWCNLRGGEWTNTHRSATEEIVAGGHSCVALGDEQQDRVQDVGQARFEPVSVELLGQTTALVTIRNVGDARGGLLAGCSGIIASGRDEQLRERVRDIPVAEPLPEDFPPVEPGAQAQATVDLRTLDGVTWTKIGFHDEAVCR